MPKIVIVMTIMMFVDLLVIGVVMLWCWGGDGD